VIFDRASISLLATCRRR